jgi:hypothetical protein
METRELPKAAQELVKIATENGWKVIVRHDSDTGGNPLVSIDVARDVPLWYFRLTWHTRPTKGKTYRLFSKIYRHVPIEGRGTYWSDLPSLKWVTTKIIANPVQDGTETGEATS